jgi:hypothetical protein
MYNREIVERLEKIHKRVLEVTGVDVKKEKRRFQEIIYAKKIFCVVARQKRATYHQISDFLGNNHATCINHSKDFEYLCKTDDELKRNYLRVLGMPQEGKLTRDFFDLTLGML